MVGMGFEKRDYEKDLLRGPVVRRWMRRGFRGCFCWDIARKGLVFFWAG